MKIFYRTEEEGSSLPGSPSKLESMDATSAVGTTNEDDMKRLTVSDLKALFASNDEQLPLTSAPHPPDQEPSASALPPGGDSEESETVAHETQ